jgi:Beta/Gamma crystallin
MKDNQHQQMFTELTAEFEAPAFQELDNETAAAIGGGANIDVYRDSNLRVKLGSFNFGSARLSPAANDKISSVRVNAGTWRLYEHVNYQGRFVTYRPGSHNVPLWFNDRTSSLRKIA